MNAMFIYCESFLTFRISTLLIDSFFFDVTISVVATKDKEQT